jgi:hypothetical protein
MESIKISGLSYNIEHVVQTNPIKSLMVGSKSKNYHMC